MNAGTPAYVFDTGPLRHFALQSWLGVLKFLTRDHVVLIPESVEQELAAQATSEPALKSVLDADWIRVDRSNDMEFLAAFATYENRLVAGRKNRGECGVLALGRVRGHRLVIDDGAPRRIAEKEGLDKTGTLGLLCQGIREDKLTVTMVEGLADDLLEGTYFLPFGRGEFRRWANGEGLIGPDDG